MLCLFHLDTPIWTELSKLYLAFILLLLIIVIYAVFDLCLFDF